MGRHRGVAVAATLLVLQPAFLRGVALQSVARAGDAPPIPFEDRGACPFEGCVYREWTVRAPVDVHRDRQVGAPQAFRLRARETVTAISGVVVTLTAGRVQFREPRDLSTASGRIHIEPGQTLFLLTHEGEGLTKAWFNGQYYLDMDAVDFLNGVCEIRQDRCAGTIVEKSRTEWWVQVRNKAGAVGWTNEPDKFDGKDALGSGLGQEAPIPFEIKPEKAIIQNDKAFSVRMTLRNTGKDDQRLSITSCSSAYPSLWSSDNPDVHVEQVSCLRKKNFVLRLKPGETYERTLSVRVSIPAASITGKPLKKTFRLGFFPSGIPMQNVFTWSNAITVVVQSPPSDLSEVGQKDRGLRDVTQAGHEGPVLLQEVGVSFVPLG